MAQERNPYYAGQEILAPKQLRWWWNNPHYAVYADSSGAWVPQGPQTEWVPQSKSLTILEYGFSSVDKATNQPNVFVDPKSTESASPFWSIWDSAEGGIFWPSATTRRAWRSRRSTNIGTSMATMGRAAPACR